jgi:hypothetical protein
MAYSRAKCKKCPANTFKAVRGTGACQACLFGLVSAEASEDLQQCVAEDVLGSLQVHFVSFVKGAGSSLGFLEEEQSERRWRQHALEAVALNADHANEQLTSALSAASERICAATQHVLSQLHRIVLQLFASAAELLQLFASAADVLQLFASAADVLQLFASAADVLQDDDVFYLFFQKQK